MKKIKNENGTYNVYDIFEQKWLIVDCKWIGSNIDLRKVTELELHPSITCNNELKVIYKNGTCKWYRNVYGTWGQPYTMN